MEMSLDRRKIEVLLGCSVVVLFSIKHEDDRYKVKLTAVIGSLSKIFRYTCVHVKISSAVFKAINSSRTVVLGRQKKGQFCCI